MKNQTILDLLDLNPLEPAGKGGLGTFKSINIGGLGDIRLKAIRFDTYTLESFDGQYWLRPEYNPTIQDSCKQDSEYSGVDLLVSLSALYDKINRPGESNKASSELIAEWCAGHIHPYAQQAVLDEMELEDDISESEENPIEVDPDDPMEQLLSAKPHAESDVMVRKTVDTRIENCAAFPLAGFIEDLHRLVSAFHTYLAIADLKAGNPETAKSLYYAGKLYDAPVLFEHFRTNDETIWADDVVMYRFADMFLPLRMKMVYDWDHDCMKLLLAT